MFLLLTRPSLDSIKTKNILKKYGHKVYIEPMFKIKHLQTRLVQDFDIIISTSSNGIRALNKISQERSCSVITVGNSTMEVARELGFANVTSSNGNVNNLILYLKEHRLQKFKLLYVRGKEISCDLKKVLTEDGFIVEEVILYESINRQKLTRKCKDFLLANMIDGILFFSVKTAKTFCSLVVQSDLLNGIKDIIAYSMSQKITESLSIYNWQNIITSSRPTQESLIKIIRPPA